MSFKNILVPHDLGAVSDYALENTIDIAKLVIYSKITIFHVLQDIIMPSTYRLDSRPIYSFKTGEVVTPSVYIKEVFHEMWLEALKKLENKKQKCEKEKILCEVKIVNGNPIEQIIKYIREKNWFNSYGNC